MRFTSLVLAICLGGAGCNRQDVDGLGRIGRKLLERTQSAASPLRDKFDQTIQGVGAVGLRQRVQLRLRWDKALADSNIDVIVTEKDVELKGTLKRDEQRRRALELAEATAGVGCVTDHLQLE